MRDRSSNLTGSFVSAGRTAALGAAILLLASLPSLAADCRAEAEAGQDWTGCNRRNLMLSGVDLQKAKLVGTDLGQSDLRGADLTGADLSEAKLGRTSLSGAKAEGANFDRVEGYRTDLSKIAAKGASFRSSELQRSNFAGADLVGSRFEKAELGRADFRDARLGENSFAFANLARANLKGVNVQGGLDFTGAYMFLTRIESLDLSKSRGLEQSQIDMSCGDGATKLPEGLNPPSGWPCRFD